MLCHVALAQGPESPPMKNIAAQILMSKAQNAERRLVGCSSPCSCSLTHQLDMLLVLARHTGKSSSMLTRVVRELNKSLDDGGKKFLKLIQVLQDSAKSADSSLSAELKMWEPDFNLSRHISIIDALFLCIMSVQKLATKGTMFYELVMKYSENVVEALQRVVPICNLPVAAAVFDVHGGQPHSAVATTESSKAQVSTQPRKIILSRIEHKVALSIHRVCGQLLSRILAWTVQAGRNFACCEEYHLLSPALASVLDPEKTCFTVYHRQLALSAVQEVISSYRRPPPRDADEATVCALLDERLLLVDVARDCVGPPLERLALRPNLLCRNAEAESGGKGSYLRVQRAASRAYACLAVLLVDFSRDALSIAHYLRECGPFPKDASRMDRVARLSSREVREAVTSFYLQTALLAPKWVSGNVVQYVNVWLLSMAEFHISDQYEFTRVLCGSSEPLLLELFSGVSEVLESSASFRAKRTVLLSIVLRNLAKRCSAGFNRLKQAQSLEDIRSAQEDAKSLQDYFVGIDIVMTHSLLSKSCLVAASSAKPNSYGFGSRSTTRGGRGQPLVQGAYGSSGFGRGGRGGSGAGSGVAGVAGGGSGAGGSFSRSASTAAGSGGSFFHHASSRSSGHGGISVDSSGLGSGSGSGCGSGAIAEVSFDSPEHEHLAYALLGDLVVLCPLALQSKTGASVLQLLLDRFFRHAVTAPSVDPSVLTKLLLGFSLLGGVTSPELSAHLRFLAEVVLGIRTTSASSSTSAEPGQRFPEAALDALVRGLVMLPADDSPDSFFPATPGRKTFPAYEDWFVRQAELRQGFLEGCIRAVFSGPLHSHAHTQASVTPVHTKSACLRVLEAVYRRPHTHAHDDIGTCYDWFLPALLTEFVSSEYTRSDLSRRTSYRVAVFGFAANTTRAGLPPHRKEGYIFGESASPSLVGTDTRCGRLWFAFVMALTWRSVTDVLDAFPPASGHSREPLEAALLFNKSSSFHTYFQMLTQLASHHEGSGTRGSGNHSDSTSGTRRPALQVRTLVCLPTPTPSLTEEEAARRCGCAAMDLIHAVWLQGRERQREVEEHICPVLRSAAGRSHRHGTILASLVNELFSRIGLQHVSIQR
eukprot:Rmarinus@m.10385